MESPAILIVVNFIGFFLALSAHEFSHALAAFYLGDRTAAEQGRLTLNPLAHIDLFGTVLLPLILILTNAGIVIGWAKPVPVNYYALRNAKWGPAIVSLAGPLANLIFACFCLLCLVFVDKFTGLGSNNLLVMFLPNLAFLNIVLMIFNLIPIPPLDGSKILYAFLPSRFDNFKMMLDQYGIILLLVVLFVGLDFVFIVSRVIFMLLLNLFSLL